MDIRFYIWEVVVNIISACSFTYILYKRLNVKSAKWKYVYCGIGIVVIAAIVSAMNYFDLNLAQTVTAGITIYWNRVIVTGLIFIFSLLSFNGNLSEKIMWGVIPMFIIALADFASLSITALIFRSDIHSVTQYGFSRIIVTIIHSLVIVTMCILLAKSGREKHKIFIPATVRYLLIVIVLLGTMAVDILLDNIYVFQNDGMTFNNDAMHVSVTFLFMVITIFMLVMKVGILTNENMEYMLENQQRKLEEDSFRQTLTNIEEIRNIKHDINQHIDVMQGLLADGHYEKLKEYFGMLTGNYSEKTNVILLSDPVISSLIYSKIILMKKEEIAFHSQLLDMDNIPIGKFDMCSILGNLLDNAIEACKKMEAIHARYIDLSVKRHSDMLMIKVENSYNGQYRKDSAGHFISNKKGHGHGLGIKYVNRLVQSNKGNMFAEPDDTVFHVNIVLPYITE